MSNHTFSTLPSSKAMLNELAKAGTIPTPPTAMTIEFTDLKGFIPQLNKVSQCVHDEYFENEELLVARDTETAKPPGHPIRTDCRPNITLAFQSYWGNQNDTPMSWTRVELVGEKASTGSTDPLLKTASYAHYWLLDRPDRMVALSFLSSQRGITFLVAPQGTTTTYTHFLPWRAPSITKIVFAFLYRLYDPGEWAIPQFSRRVDVNDPVFDIRIDQTIYVGFKPIFASNPFKTRVHVFANPDHATVRVIKSQLSRNSRRFLEREIYNHIHRDGDVPGIPHVHFFFDLPAPDALRTQNIIGLREHGYPIMMAATLRDVLEILYDILEVMRFLYFTHHVLHRDISKGNILFLVESISPEPIPAGGKDIRFVQHLLSDSATPSNPHKTRAMLIDFNNSEILGAKEDISEDKETIRTGTPGFMSRAVEYNGALPPAKLVLPIATGIYANKNKDRIERFALSASDTLPQPQSTNKPWRHDLEHDTESVFWVLFYWLMTAQPSKASKEFINNYVWTAFTTSWLSRDALLLHIPPNAFHSSYAPAVTLVEDMAEVIRHDRYWLPEQDPQNRPEVALDAFQRLILDFIIKKGTENCMSMMVDARNPRVPGFGPRSVSLTGTPDLFESLSKDQDELGAKRKGESANDEDGSTSKKARRATTHLDGDTADDAGECDAAENNTDAQGSDQAEAQNPPLQMWEKLKGTQKIVIAVENGRYVPRLKH
ncbi:hypothetical protein ONZ45_g7680 [Pleurotus djamor]|nr:hypothetical protein ONZ45_g7680 [Pleurotus djamor]